jgi:hypothetical protein
LQINAFPCSCSSMSFSLSAPTRFTSPHLQIFFYCKQMKTVPPVLLFELGLGFLLLWMIISRSEKKCLFIKLVLFLW